MYNTINAEVMQMDMECLLEKLGIIDTPTLKDLFLIFLRERFDYTEWRKKYFANVDLETFFERIRRI